MNLSQLNQNLSTSIRPANFDAFWEKVLISKADTLPVYDLHETTSPSLMVCCHDLWFKGTGNVNIHAKYVRPSHNNKVPLVLQFHPYLASSRDWHYLMRFVALGYAVIAMDARGQGGKSKSSEFVGLVNDGADEVQNMYFGRLYRDACQVAQIAMHMDDIDHEHIISYGEDQGGALALVVASMFPQIWKCAILNPILSDPYHTWHLGGKAGCYQSLFYYFRYSDPQHIQEEELFAKLAYLDIQHFAPKVKAEVLFGTGLMDEVSFPETQLACYHKIQSPKKHIVYPKYANEFNRDFENECLQFFAKSSTISIINNDNVRPRGKEMDCC